MQKSYLVKQTVDFGQVAKFLIRPGDILVFDPTNHNKVTVYRNGEIQKILPNQSLSGLQGLAKSGWIIEIHPNDAPRQAAQAPKVAPPAPQKAQERVSAPASGKGATSTAAQPQKPAKKPAPLVIEDSTV